MRETIILSQQEANTLLEELIEFPIRCLAVVQHVQRWLAEKFAEPIETTDGVAVLSEQEN